MSLPFVSVVVPTYNSAEYLARCLQSITQQTYCDLELIVVDNHSTDETVAIAQQHTSHVYTYGTERSAQRNYGTQQARGEYVLMIDSDMELTPNVIQSCVNAITANPQLKALIIPEESFGEGFWAKCKKLERSFYSGIDWQEAARFFEMQVYRELGGYDEQQIGSEDYDLPNRLEHRYGKDRIARIADLIYHNERKLSLGRLLKKKFYYARTLKQYINQAANQERFRQQTSVLRRYALFFSQPTKLFSNPLVGCGMLLMKTCEFAVGLTGYVLSRVQRIS